MRINRYNRSFIGLMEMCYDGKWCKWNEVEKKINQISNAAHYEVMEATKYRELYEKLYLTQHNPKILLLKTYLKIIFVLSIICNLVLAARLDGVL
jgi:hypothetical protein